MSRSSLSARCGLFLAIATLCACQAPVFRSVGGGTVSGPPPLAAQGAASGSSAAAAPTDRLGADAQAALWENRALLLESLLLDRLGDRPAPLPSPSASAGDLGQGTGTAHAAPTPGATQTPGWAATVLSRRQGLVTQYAYRLDAMTSDRTALASALTAAPWTPGPNGLESQTVAGTLQEMLLGQLAHRQFSLTRTVDVASGLIETWSASFVQTLGSGTHRVSTLSETLGQDGSTQAVFHAESDLASGLTRMVDWKAAIALDGTLSGSGSISWTDAGGSGLDAIALTLSGTEDTPHLRAAEGAGVETVVLPLGTSVTVPDEANFAQAAPSGTASAAPSSKAS